VKNYPKISIVFALRNEEKIIAETIQNIQNLDYPQDKIEIICAEGCSEDKTLDILREMKDKDSRIQILKNSKQIAASGWNIGIQASNSNFVLIMSGHAQLSKNYLKSGIEKLISDENIGGVSGPTKPVGKNAFGDLLASAYQSPFGVGNARYFLSKKEEEAETIVFGIYRKSVLVECGLFSEEIVRGQDWELNYRIRKHGYTLFLLPHIKSKYVVRGSFLAVWKRHFSAGKWKMTILKNHPKSILWRHFIPLAFAIIIIIGLIGALFYPRWMIGIVGGGIVYLVVSILFLAQLRKKRLLYEYVLMIVLFWIIQFSYGLGFLVGIIKLLFVSPFQKK